MDALIQAAAVTGTVDHRLTLTVTILRLSLPLFGAGVTASADAHYELVDTTTGHLLDADTVLTTGYTPFSCALAAVVRGNEATNHAVRNNIKSFLEELQKTLAGAPTQVGASSGIPPEGWGSWKQSPQAGFRTEP